MRNGGGRREPFRSGKIRVGDVAREWALSAELLCSLCGDPGATLACKGGGGGCAQRCRQRWHLPCARQAAQQEGGVGGGVCFSATVFEAACEECAAVLGWAVACHAILEAQCWRSVPLPPTVSPLLPLLPLLPPAAPCCCSISHPLLEPAGVWFEGVGGWDNHSAVAKEAWLAAPEVEAARGGDDSSGDEAGPPEPPTHGQQQQSEGRAGCVDTGCRELYILGYSDDDSDGEEPPPLLQQQTQQQSRQLPRRASVSAADAGGAGAAGSVKVELATASGSAAAAAAAAGAASAGGTGVDAAGVHGNAEEEGEPSWVVPGHQFQLRGDVGGEPPLRDGELLVSCCCWRLWCVFASSSGRRSELEPAGGALGLRAKIAAAAAGAEHRHTSDVQVGVSERH